MNNLELAKCFHCKHIDLQYVMKLNLQIIELFNSKI